MLLSELQKCRFKKLMEYNDGSGKMEVIINIHFTYNAMPLDFCSMSTRRNICD